MSYGKFFALDAQASDISHGVAVFNYLLVCDPQGGQNFDTPQYPIFCVFEKDGVFFYEHHYKKRGKTNVSSHTCSAILELPISGDAEVKDALSIAITESYETVYPDVSSLTDDLNKAFGKIFCIDDSKSSLVLSDEIYYSSLSCFRIKYSKGDVSIEHNDFIRKLFLDFLYDFEHSDIFNNSKHYERVYALLHKNFLFHAIQAKAEYYFYREIMNRWFFDDINKIFGSEDDSRSMFNYLNKMIESELAWVRIIADSRSDMTFSRYKDGWWFEGSDREMDYVFLRHKNKGSEGMPSYGVCGSDMVAKVVNVRKRGHLRAYEISVAYLVSRLSGEDSTKSLEEGKSAFAFVDIFDKKVNGVTKRQSDIAEIAITWYLKECNLAGVYKVRHGNSNWGIILFLILVLLAVLIILRVVSVGTIFPLAHYGLYECVTWGCIVLFLQIVPYAFSWLNRKRRFLWDKGPAKLTMPRLAAALTSAWLPIANSAGTYSMLKNTNFLSGYGLGLSLVIGILLFGLLRQSVKRSAPSCDVKRLNVRTFVLYIVSFVFSYAIGLAELILFGQSQKDVVHWFDVLGVYTPRVVMLSIICMFVGVFITNLVNNRSLTE